jgi:hypothetical protein
MTITISQSIAKRKSIENWGKKNKKGLLWVKQQA